MPYKIKPPVYDVWRSMISRCRYPSSAEWANYGGRGIRVCPEWEHDYRRFAADMGPRPPGYFIDRIDVNGNYTPGNCRWVSRRESALNQRRTLRVTIEGITHRVADLALQAGLKADTILERAKTVRTLAELVSPERRVFHAGLALGGEASGAAKRAATHCKHGHEFSAANTRFTKEGWRNCRACHAAKMRRLKAKKRAQEI